MSTEKIKTDFEKCFGRKCERVHFVGKTVTFFDFADGAAGCCIGSGGFAALARRRDDRLDIRFSDSRELLTINDREGADGNEIGEFLKQVRKIGVKPCGADILFDCGKPGIPYDVLMAVCLDTLCKNPPPPSWTARCFGDYRDNILTFAAKRGTMAVVRGTEISYMPLLGNSVKIILCYAGCRAGDFPSSCGTAEGAFSALENGDYEKFERELNKYYDLKKGVPSRLRRLRETALVTNEACGVGFLKDGGIFAVVKNENVDNFVRKFCERCRMFYGGIPEVYIGNSEAGSATVF